MIVDEGVDMDTKDIHGRTGLMWACLSETPRW